MKSFIEYQEFLNSLEQIDGLMNNHGVWYLGWHDFLKFNAYSSFVIWPSFGLSGMLTQAGLAILGGGLIYLEKSPFVQNKKKIASHLVEVLKDELNQKKILKFFAEAKQLIISMNKTLPARHRKIYPQLKNFDKFVEHLRKKEINEKCVDHFLKFHFFLMSGKQKKMFESLIEDHVRSTYVKDLLSTPDAELSKQSTEPSGNLNELLSQAIDAANGYNTSKIDTTSEPVQQFKKSSIRERMSTKQKQADKEKEIGSTKKNYQI